MKDRDSIREHEAKADQDLRAAKRHLHEAEEALDSHGQPDPVRRVGKHDRHGEARGATAEGEDRKTLETT